MRLSVFFLAVFCVMIVGCEGSNDGYSQKNQEVSSVKKKKASQEAYSEEKNENQFKPFYIFKDTGSRNNHYVPSGFMPNGKCLKFSGSWTENCYSGSTCLRIVYDIECSRDDQKWGGIYWLNPPNNWGSRKGGYNLTGATKLTFWAKGLRGGEHLEEFKVGGIEGNYPDSDVAVIGPIILSPEWKQYSIDLRGKDLSSITGGFAWSANEEMNPESCEFFLDEMRFE